MYMVTQFGGLVDRRKKLYAADTVSFRTQKMMVFGRLFGLLHSSTILFNPDKSFCVTEMKYMYK